MKITVDIEMSPMASGRWYHGIYASDYWCPKCSKLVNLDKSLVTNEDTYEESTKHVVKMVSDLITLKIECNNC